MTSKVRTLEDGFKITDVVCDKCGNHRQITHEDVTFSYCLCGTAHMNIAYYFYDEDGVLCFNSDYYYVKEKFRKNDRNNL